MSLNLDKSTWKRVFLGDVATASKEKVDPTDGSIDRYVAGEHMDSDDLKIHRWGDIGDIELGPAFHRRFRPGQVLYGSRRTYLRKVAVADFDGVCANTTFVVETRNSDVLLQEFLPLIMTTEPFHAFAIAESKGSVNPYVNWTDIEQYEFDLPPIDEQKRLAELFWSVEQHRLSLSLIGKTLENTANNWLSEIIGVGDDTLSEYCDVLVGFAFPSRSFSKKSDANSRRLLRGINIGNGDTRWGPSETVYWNEELNNKTKKFTLRPGDIVIPMDRPFTGGGRLRWAELGLEESGVLLVQRVARLRPHKYEFSPILRAIIRSKAFQESLSGSLTGSFAPHLAHGDFNLYRFSVSSPNGVSKVVVRLEESEVSANAELKRVEALRQLLLSDIFGGSQ